MITRRQIRQFIAVAETGGFTAAAQRLRVTQPTLSSAIAELERELDAALFLREKRGVRLTEAGNSLLAHARAIEREFRQAETGIGAQAHAEKPALRLGVLASVASPMLASLAAHYGAPLVLSEGGDARLRRDLATGRIDAALTLLREGERAGVVLEEPYVMVLPARHRLAGARRVAAEALANETMIARRSCEILPETSRFFTHRGVRPHLLLRSANDDRCLAMVRAGLGVTTAPRSLAGPGTASVEIEGYDFTRRIGLLAPAGTPLPAVLDEAWAATLDEMTGTGQPAPAHT